MGRLGHIVPVRPEEPVEPTRTGRLERLRGLHARRVDGIGDRAERDTLLALVPRDRVADPRDVGLERVALAEQRAALVVQRRRRLQHAAAETVATAVVRLGREARLGGAERKLVSVPRHPRREQRVLERILALGELARDEALLTLQAQTRDRFPLGSVGGLLRRAQRVELRSGEQIRVARDDRRLLRRVLLPHAHRADLLRALDAVLLEAALELGDRERAHAATSAPWPSRASARARPRSASDSYRPGDTFEPVTATRIGA